jgi:hypothetical protein
MIKPVTNTAFISKNKGQKGYYLSNGKVIDIYGKKIGNWKADEMLTIIDNNNNKIGAMLENGIIYDFIP